MNVFIMNHMTYNAYIESHNYNLYKTQFLVYCIIQNDVGVFLFKIYKIYNFTRICIIM